MITPPQNPSQGGYGPVSPGDSGSTANEDLKRTARQLGEETRHLGEEARVQGKEQLEGLRGTAAENLDKLAEGVQSAASTLQRDDVGHLSQYVSDMATRMSDLSTTLRTKSGDELLRDIGQLARENPALFITGSLAIGFGLARFARASQQKAMEETAAERAESSYSPQTGTHDYAATSGATGRAGTYSGSVPVNPVDPASDQTGTSGGTQGGIH